MKNTKNSLEKNEKGNAFKSYIKAHYPVLILIFVGYLFVSGINIFEVATSQTIMTLNVSDFEIGQISDRTILAPRSIPADELNPVFIEEGEKIIRKGFAITEEAYAKLQKMAASPNYIDWRVFANSEIYLALIVVMWYFLFAVIPFGRKIRLRELVYQCVCFILVYAAVTFGGKVSTFNADFSLCIIIPATFFVLIHAILYGQLSATFFSLILSFGVFDASGWCIVPFLYTLASCLCGTAIVKKIEHRIDMIFVALMQAVYNLVIVGLLAVIFNEPFNSLPFVIGFVALNGFLSGILALALITPIELILNTASVFRMMDLCDTNTPILKKLFITAGGTYQHSQMVGQLAENACREIGANALLAKVGAWYHDLGKMEKSEYFVENLPSGEANPHEKISPSLSASILRNHVRKSVEIARQLLLPQQVVEIIEEHHGNSLMAFFYNKAKEQDPNTNMIDYMYPGNPPSSKESAVVMLADSCEAASRTLENPTEERLDVFIQTIFDGKMKGGQLDNCNLSFNDLTKIKLSFVKLLTATYHNRIKYPNQKDPEQIKKEEEEKAKKEAEMADTTAAGDEPKAAAAEANTNEAASSEPKEEKKERKRKSKKENDSESKKESEKKVEKESEKEIEKENKTSGEENSSDTEEDHSSIISDKTLDGARLNG